MKSGWLDKVLSFSLSDHYDHVLTHSQERTKERATERPRESTLYKYIKQTKNKLRISYIVALTEH
jgi:hypothetical protein